MFNYVVLQEGCNGMVVFSEGLCEFEVIGEEKKIFVIMLLCGVGLLGKEDLFLRSGWFLGIKMLVLDLQLCGLFFCCLSLLSYIGMLIVVGVVQQV